MLIQSYKRINSDEIVPKEEALEYVLEQLKLYIEPKEKGGYSLEQIEFLDMIVEWYFSGNWIEIVEEED